MTHACDTVDALINFEIISPLTSSTITITGSRKWKYINLGMSRTKQAWRIKKAYFIFLKGHLADY